MVQAWKCVDCGTVTTDPKEAGDHERKHNDGRLQSGPILPGQHFMEDLGE